ncbi:hypothetical protein EV698_0964 [Spiribacter vilamensis]|uniref:Permease n=1 Tax=Spiribacter vilamensis TaxID=531306 RepID=A0A4V2GJ27_9GAMM|nr:hypothetical protein EV698_0964 [Spiribacter vilamensis]
MIASTLDTALVAAPWLLLGLVAAGIVQALMPASTLQRWMGGRGIGGVTRAAIIGAPLPLCSCGAIPTAMALHKAGAGRGPTTAFLIGTPGIGIDSLAVSYALLGPFMTLARAGMAVGTAIVTGLMVAMTDRHPIGPASPAAAACGCTSQEGCTDDGEAASGLIRRLRDGLRYAFTEVLDDLSLWLLIGLGMAGVLIGLVPPATLAEFSTHPGAKALMAIVGIPMYICATAATPIAAGLLIAGATPGTVLVFLVAGPVTSMATLGMLGRRLGRAALGAYLAGIIGATIGVGLFVDAVAGWSGLNVSAQVGSAAEWLPVWLKAVCLLVLAGFMIRPVRRRIGNVFDG